MPYPNHHSARLHNPDDFNPDTFRTVADGTIYGKIKVPATVNVIWGKLKTADKPADNPIPQALRFSKSNWTADEAKKWLKDNNVKYVSFEPASEGDSFEPDIERRYLTPELLIEERGEGDNKTPVLIGYAAVFDSLSLPLCGFREKINKGAFTESIQVDDIRALIDHDSSKILGRNKAGTLRLQEDDKGLKVEIDIPPTTTGRDLITSVKRGDISQMSFGFRTISDEWHKEDEQDIRTLSKVKLFDVSAVTFPAYQDTTIAVRSYEQWKSEQTQPENNNDVLRLKLDLAEKE